MFNIKLISLNGFFGLDKNEQEIDIIDEYISSEFFKQMEIIYDVFTVDCDICSNEEEFKNSLISSAKDNDAVVILGGLTQKSKINAKQLVARGLGLDIVKNEEIKAMNTEFCIKQGMEYTSDIDFMSFIPSGAQPFLMESSLSYSYVLNLNGKFIIHTSHDENEVKKCLGTKVIPYLFENTENTASEEEISLTGLSQTQFAAFPIRNQKDVSFCMYKVGKEVRGRIIVNKGSVKKSEKYMDKLFDKIEKWANGDYLRKEIKENKKQNNKGFWAKVFPAKNDSGRTKAKKIILMLVAIIFIASMSYFGIHYLKSYLNDKQYAEIMELYGQNIELPDGYPDDYSPQFASLYKVNEDIKGYIKVKGTRIDYPVVQKGDNDYYLKRNFKGEKSEHAVPFLDYEIDLINSKNFIIYGNNMKDGQMFADFIKYKDLSFYKEHPVIRFDNVYEKGIYKIVSVFRVTANKDHKDIFNYQNFVNPMNEDETQEFLKEISRRSIINTGVSYDETDKFLTVSTCTDEFEGARFAIVARKVRDGENSVVDTDKSTVNENALMPDIWYELYGGTKPVFDESDTNVKPVGNVLSGQTEDEQPNGESDESTSKEQDDIKVESVKLNQNEGMLYTKVTYKLSATVYPENATNKNVTWESDNEEVVTTDQNGKIVAVSEGVANITATSEDGNFSDSCKIIVKSDGIKVTGISLDKTQGSLKKGQITSLKAVITPNDAKNKNVLWESSDNKIATVDKSGNVTAISVGTVKITARTEDGGKTAFFNLNVKADDSVATEVVINKEKLSLNVGDEYTFTAKVNPENAVNKKVTYECSNTNIASVYADGTIKALKEGKVTIKAYVKGTDAFAECVVDVISKEEEKPAEEVISSGDEITVKNQSGEKITDSAYNIICQITQGEVGGGFSTEAIKAQAVAAYTYVMYNADKGVIPSVVMAESVTSKIKNAVSDVIGQAIYYNGKYINAVYHAASSGYTTSADKVWGGGVSYLVPVESAGDEKCKYYGYDKTFGEKDIARKIEDYFDIDPYDYGDAENWFEDIKTDSGSYVDSLKVCGNKITGRKFREGLMKFSISSHAFEIDYSGGNFIITTYGYGHGVGMSQYGAQHLASEGYAYDEILKHYYSGVTVK